MKILNRAFVKFNQIRDDDGSIYINTNIISGLEIKYAPIFHVDSFPTDLYWLSEEVNFDSRTSDIFETACDLLNGFCITLSLDSQILVVTTRDTIQVGVLN